MADITQLVERNSIKFSADSPAAQQWMRKHYGSHQIHFDIADHQDDILAFIKATKAQGFSIRWL